MLATPAPSGNWKKISIEGHDIKLACLAYIKIKSNGGWKEEVFGLSLQEF